MYNKEIIHLFKKFINNRCDSQELERVLNYIENGEFLDEWDFVIQEEADNALAGNDRTLDIMSDHQKIALQKRIEKRASNDRRPIWMRYSIAALVLVTLSFSLLLFSENQPNIDEQQERTKAQDVSPGGDNATLTLADGTTIELNKEGTGNVALQESTNIFISEDGELVYQATDNDLNKVSFNTLSTPRGGQYQVVLPDGTRAWLNAESSIIYPTAFIEDRRTVSIKGEVYFEVKHDKDRPFMVETAGHTIEVLGTHFNVNAYADESSIRTTLMEGSVKVILPSNKSSLLSPGQQSVVVKGKDQIAIGKVDTEAAIGWKNGDIYFNDTDLKEVMRQLARWYDVDVDYKGMPNKKLNGIISRNVDLSVVLEAIEQTSNISLRIEIMPRGLGRRVSME